MNDTVGNRACAQLVGVAAAVDEVARAAGHHALAHRARTAIHTFTSD